MSETTTLERRFRRERITGEGQVEYDDQTIGRLIERLDETVAELLAAFDPDAGDRIWPSHPLGEDHPEAAEPWREIQRSYGKLEDLARAYVLPTSTYEGDDRLIAAIRAGFAALGAYYRPDQRTYGNWFQWEIGIPKRMLPTLLLVGDELPDDLVEHHLAAVRYHVGTPTIRQGSGDLLSKADLWVQRGILEDNGEVIRAGIEPIAETLAYTAENNITPDGSAIDHGNIPYSLHYQGRFFRELTRVASLLRDTPFSLRKPSFPGDIERAYEWAYEVYEPLIWRARAMSMVLGRHQRHRTETRHGTTILDAFLQLHAIAPEPHASRYAAIAARWIDAGGIERADASSIPQYALRETVFADPAIEPAPPLKRYKQYYNMDRAVARTAAYAYGIAMHSERTGNYEVLSDGRGPSRGWFTSRGMTYLYTSDRDQYDDAYWQTVDPLRLPGTTVTPRRVDEIRQSTEAETAHAGGVAFGPDIGASSMVVRSVLEPELLGAHKSWFCFGDCVVAVGSAIAGDAGEGSIETTVANRNLGPTDAGTLRLDGTTVDATEARAVDDVGWAHLDRPSESVGLAFPGDQTMCVRRGPQRSDDPRAGTRDADGETYTRHYATLWLDHGPRPTSDSYVYCLLPDVDARSTAAWAAESPIDVRHRSPAAHVVEHADRHLVGIQSFAETRIDGIDATVDGPAAVMYERSADELTVALADPTLSRDRIAVELPVGATDVIDADPAVAVTNTDPVGLCADLTQVEPGRHGRTMTATFGR